MSAYLSIRAVAAKSGLSVHTIRAWEKRYGALVPERTDSNRRLYTEADASRLSLMRQVVEAGHNISQIVRMPVDELSRLASERNREPRTSGIATQLESDLPGECEQAVDHLDAVRLNQALNQSLMQSGIELSISQVVLPLLGLLDRRYEEGSYHMAHEHMLSTTVRGFLERILRSLPYQGQAPKMIVTTPSGQTHEIGALLACIFSALQGWQVVYLGPNLPADQIGAAAKLVEAKVVALSLVYQTSTSDIESELYKLRSAVGDNISIIVGGRAASEYAEAIHAIDGERIDDLASLKSTLHRLQKNRM